MRIFLGPALAVSLAFGASAQTVADTPRLLLTESAGLAWTEAPIRTGLPLPRGSHSVDTTWQVRSPRGQAVPTQTRVLETWDDGSIRWLLVDALVDTPRKSRASLSVVPGPTGSDRTIRATTGVPAELRSAFLVVSIDEAGTLTVRRLGSPGGTIGVSGPALRLGGPDTFTVERITTLASGPVHAEVLIEGVHAAGLRSIVRVSANGRSDAIRLRHTVINETRTEGAAIESLAFAVSIPNVLSATALVDGRPHPLDPARPQSLRQDAPQSVTLEGKGIGSHLDDAVRLTTDSANVTIIVPDLWQQFPKGIDVSKSGVTVDLFPATPQPVVLGIGAAKTHDVWLEIDARRKPSMPLDEAVLRYRSPPRAIPHPAWTHRTGAVTRMPDPEFGPTREFLGRLRHDTKRYLARAQFERWDSGPPGPCEDRTASPPRVGFYGLLNWGDWNFPGYKDGSKGCDAWGNLEYDLGLVFGLAWLATADPEWVAPFERTITHYRDVDVIHADPTRPGVVGLNHPHKVGHFQWGGRRTTDLGHTWLDGLLLHYRLTGDVRSRDVAVKMADQLATRLHKATNARQFGWPLIALAGAASLGDPKHAKAARQFAIGAMRRHKPTPGSNWKLGILASGLAAEYRISADPAVRTWLDDYGKTLLAAERPAELDPRHLATTGDLATLFGVVRYQALALDTVATLPLGTWGKPLALYGRTGFEILAALGRPATR